jgi:IS30 family transposase
MVIDRLRNWSPEQIAGRLKTDGVGPFRICTETIYRFASPWQKGTVENVNRRIRRFLPRYTDLMQIDGLHLSRLCRDLNTTPRKCLGYRTPEEVFAQHLQQL